MRLAATLRRPESALGGARELLDATVPISEVSVAVGYADQSHFTRRFQRLLGITPAKYMRGQRPARS